MSASILFKSLYVSHHAASDSPGTGLWEIYVSREQGSRVIRGERVIILDVRHAQLTIRCNDNIKSVSPQVYYIRHMLFVIGLVEEILHETRVWIRRAVHVHIEITNQYQPTRSC